MMRDSHDRCLTSDCRSIPAGEIVQLDSPYLLEVMGRPAIRVKYGIQVFYLPAEDKVFAIAGTAGSEDSKSLIGKIWSAPAKLVSASNTNSTH